jgi:hypothetical protein
VAVIVFSHDTRIPLEFRRGKGQKPAPISRRLKLSQMALENDNLCAGARVAALNL